MGLLRQLFGPSKEDIWRQLCNEIGAQYVKGGFWKGDKVQAHYGQWTVTLDTYTETYSDGNTAHSTFYTRLRAPYVNKDGFRFTIYRKSVFSGLGKVLGMQDVEVGYPEFDEAFVIKGNDETKLRALFAKRENPAIDRDAARHQSGGQGRRGVVRHALFRRCGRTLLLRDRRH